MLNFYNLKEKNPKSGVLPAVENGSDAKMLKKGDFKKYIDYSSELSTRRLKLGIWVASHRKGIKKTTIAVLIAVVVAFWLFSGIKWFYYIIDTPFQSKMERELASFQNYTNINNLLQPSNIQIVGVQVFNSSVDKIDVVAEVINPNEHFIISFDYSFAFNQNETPIQRAIILPGQGRPVASLGVDKLSAVGSPNIIISNLSYKRISAHEVSDPKAWQDYRLDFEISGLKFVPVQSGNQQSADASIISFNLENSSPYNYKGASFYIGLRSGGSFVSLLPLYIDYFSSLQTENIDLRSFVSGLYVDDVELYPLINPYESDAYAR
ncbi:MAG: hypothetical protein ABH832_02210 [bacterium]